MNSFSILINVILGVCGLVFGSFACATAWRLRARELYSEKNKVKPEYTKLSSLAKTPILKDYSRCLSCESKLKWYDMIPLISWLVLRGKCRQCHKPIGPVEPLAELFLAIFFVSSYVFWPSTLDNGIEITKFIIWLLAGIILAVQFIYDLKWSLLPSYPSYLVVILGIINAIITVMVSGDKIATISSIMLAVALLSGLYFMIYYLSHKKWIGAGDIILGLGLALVLSDWQTAYVALFAANLVGCLVVIPGMVSGKLKRTSRVPFAPFMILGFWIAGLFGGRIMATILYGLI